MDIKTLEGYELGDTIRIYDLYSHVVKKGRLVVKSGFVNSKRHNIAGVTIYDIEKSKDRILPNRTMASACRVVLIEKTLT